MSLIRMSIGKNVAQTPTGANRFFVGLAMPTFSVTSSHIYVKEIHFFQNANLIAGKSLSIYRVIDNGNHDAGETAIGFSYLGQTVGPGVQMRLVEWNTTQPTLTTQEPIAQCFLGNNQGDYAMLRFDEPIELIVADNINPKEVLAVRIAESTGLDIDVTIVWERTHTTTA